MPLSPEGPDTGVHLADRWTDVFHADFPVHFGIMASITAACFQGFLKDRIAGPLPYALSDGFFIFGFLWWFTTRAFSRSAMLVTPRGPMLPTLLLVTLLPAMYVAVPGTPLLVQLAGLRAWSLYPLACIMALSTTYTAGQIRAYVALILALCVVTAAYGILQYRLGPGSVLAGGALSLLRHGRTIFYVQQAGAEAQFRAYSTFQFPAPFAGMMVYGMMLAAGQGFSRRAPRGGRWWLGLIVALLFVAMTVSGTRAALVMLALGLGILALLRGVRPIQILVALPMVAAAHFAALLTSGSAISRFGTLFHQESNLWVYVTSPVVVAIRTLSAHPLGVGLGRTGVGVPFAITQSMPAGYFIFSDGDIGRAAVDMGVLGIVVLAFIVFGLMPLALRATRILVGTRDEGLALGMGALVISGGVTILIGSPLSSAPHGIIWWFCLGALVKLAMERGRAPEEVGEPEEVEADAAVEPT